MTDATGHWSYTLNQSLSAGQTHTFVENGVSAQVTLASNAPVLTSGNLTVQTGNANMQALTSSQLITAVTPGVAATSITYTVSAGTTFNHGIFHAYKNGGQDTTTLGLTAANKVVTTFTQDDINQGKVKYESTSAGTDTLDVTVTINGVSAETKLTVGNTTAFPVYYHTPSLDAGAHGPQAAVSHAMWQAEPPLDFSRVAQLPALQPAAGLSLSETLRAELKVLVAAPATHADAAGVEHALIARVSGPQGAPEGASPQASLFERPAPAQPIQPIHDLFHATDALGAHANAYTELLHGVSYATH
jgi:hypothetical protein